MAETVGCERPRDRQEEVDQRAWVKDERVPLREKRQAAVAEWIPQRNFSAPETFTVMVCQRISEIAKIPKIESVSSGDNIRVSRVDKHEQNDSETAWTQPIVRRPCGRGPRG